MFEFISFILNTVIDISVLAIVLFLINLIFNKLVSQQLLYYSWLLLIIRALTPPIIHISFEKYSNEFINKTIFAFNNGNHINFEIINNNTYLIYFLVWLFGFFFGLAFLFIKNIRYRKYILTNSTIIKQSYTKIVDRCLRSLKINRSVKIIVVSESITPQTYGIFHPKIILSETVLIDEKELPCVLLHELIHIKRNDQLYLFCFYLISLIYWFNPLIWLVNLWIRYKCEISCDNIIIKKFSNLRIMYGKTIIHLTNTTPNGLNLSLSASKMILRNRIKSIAMFKNNLKILNILVSVFLIIITFYIFLDYNPLTNLPAFPGIIPSSGYEDIIHSESVENILLSEKDVIDIAINSIEDKYGIKLDNRYSYNIDIVNDYTRNEYLIKISDIDISNNNQSYKRTIWVLLDSISGQVKNIEVSK